MIKVKVFHYKKESLEMKFKGGQDHIYSDLDSSDVDYSTFNEGTLHNWIMGEKIYWRQKTEYMKVITMEGYEMHPYTHMEPYKLSCLYAVVEVDGFIGQFEQHLIQVIK